MNSKLKQCVDKINKFIYSCGIHHNGAYAAQAAFFFMLSLIPVMILLLTMIQFTPISREMVMTAVVNVFPTTVNGLIISIVNQVYTQSGTVIPITIVVALWSAGKAVLSMTNGLNCTYDCIETRNYFFLRFRATFYTVLFIVAIIVTLLLSVFGNTISAFVVKNVPFLATVVDSLMRLRTLFSISFLFVLWVLVYKFLPNRKNELKKQIPGAIFTAIGWLLMSFFFSVYLDIFKGFTSMYGSLTTIILIMMWMYFCMYITLLGGELNVAIVNCIDDRKAKLARAEEMTEDNEAQTEEKS